MVRNVRRLGALAGATTLALMTMAPALGATTVSKSSANALTISVAGNGQGSGTVTATHDGKNESVQGETSPPVHVLGNQQLLNAGVLAQEAAANADGEGVGSSAACAGVAGEGGSVAQVGDSRCLVPGQPIGLSIANLDLSGMVVFDPDSAFADLNQATQPVVDQAIGPITQAVSEGLEPLGETGLFGSAGVLESRCTSTVAGATGGATLANAQLRLALGGESVDVVNLPMHPPPNTKVVTDLGVVAGTVIDAIETDLETTLDGELAGGTQVTDAAQKEIIDAVIGEIAPQLAPLEENVLSATLNAQTRPTADSISVTALQLDVLPAAQAELGAPLVDADLANVTCGPNGRVTRTSQPLPEVPTVIDSGETEEPGHAADYALGAGALLLASVGGLLAYRRFASRP